MEILLLLPLNGYFFQILKAAYYGIISFLGMDTSTDASNQSREFSSSTVSYLEAQYQQSQLLLLLMNCKISQAVDDMFVHQNQIKASTQLPTKFKEQVFRSGSKPSRGVLKKEKNPRFSYAYWEATSEKKQNQKRNSQSLIANQAKGEPAPKVQEKAIIDDQQGSSILDGAPGKNCRLKPANIKDEEKQTQLRDKVLKMDDANKKESQKNEKAQILQNKLLSQNQSEKNDTVEIISTSEISQNPVDNRAGGVSNTLSKQLNKMKKQFGRLFEKQHKEIKGIRQILQKMLTLSMLTTNHVTNVIGDKPAH